MAAASSRHATSLGQSEQPATSRPIFSRRTAADRTRRKATVSVVPSSRRKPPRPTVVCFVRHGTTPTTGKVLPGRTPGLHLSEQGAGRSGRAASGLADGRCRAVYASPSSGPARPPPPISRRVGQAAGRRTRAGRVRLRELDGCGALAAAQAPGMAGRAALAGGFRFPGGESFVELQASLTGAVEKHLQDATPARSSSPCRTPTRIKIVLAGALGLPLDIFQRIVVAPCSIGTVVYGPDGPAVLALDRRPPRLACAKPRASRMSEDFELSGAGPRGGRRRSARWGSACSCSRSVRGGTLMTLKVEKAQVSALAQYLGRMLGELERPGELPSGRAARARAILRAGFRRRLARRLL